MNFGMNSIFEIIKNDYLCIKLICVELRINNSVCMGELKIEKWPY